MNNFFEQPGNNHHIPDDLFAPMTPEQLEAQALNVQNRTPFESHDFSEERGAQKIIPQTAKESDKNVEDKFGKAA